MCLGRHGGIVARWISHVYNHSSVWWHIFLISLYRDARISARELCGRHARRCLLHLAPARILLMDSFAARSLILRTLVAIAAAFLAPTSVALADNSAVLAGRVIKVVDGDTIDVQLQSGLVRVRFHAVDAPEKAQDYGRAATDALFSLIGGKDVQIEPFKQDRYERLVGIVYLGDLNVNAELVRNGHAWAMRRYMRKSDAELCSLESAARLGHRGLWASADAIAPWMYRQHKKHNAPTNQAAETAAKCVAAIGKPYP
jgi:micrococcal nuclease